MQPSRVQVEKWLDFVGVAACRFKGANRDFFLAWGVACSKLSSTEAAGRRSLSRCSLMLPMALHHRAEACHRSDRV